MIPICSFHKIQAKSIRLGVQESIIPKTMACPVDIELPPRHFQFCDVVQKCSFDKQKDLLQRNLPDVSATRPLLKRGDDMPDIHRWQLLLRGLMLLDLNWR